MRRILPVLALVIAVAVASRLFSFGPFKNTPVCANSISCIKDLSGKFENNQKLATFMGKKLLVPASTTELAQASPVLGATTEDKRITVDLSKQILYAYEGDNVVFSFPVSTGKWRPTPTGDFRIWIKLRYTRMTGGEGADFYDLPNVPYTMFFYNNEHPKSQGFGLHGAYWHNNFGHPMSHGCVNISIINAEKLFYWANPPTQGSLTYATADDPGTPLTIFGETPNE